MAEESTRRSFLKAAAIAAGPAVIAARGANEKINVGWIGVGTRGDYGIRWLHDAAPDEVQLTAICDTCQYYIDRGIANVQKTWGNAPKTYKDYRELLADKSIDAVYIMTPEHLHHDMAIAALQAGKHVYTEKPLAHNIAEGWNIVAAWEKSGKICQVGTQNRSSMLYKTAKDWIKQGMIGDVHYARAFWYRNSAPNNPAWRYVIPPGVNEQNTDWNRFLGSAPKRPWDPRRYFQWRLYWDYSGGISTDLLVHQTDIINFMLDKDTPTSVIASGGIYRWTAKDDDRDTGDTMSAIFEYPNGFHINYSSYFGNVQYGYGEQIMGNEGTIEIMNRSDLYFKPETYSGVAANIKARKPIHMMNDAAPEVKAGAKSDFKEVDGVQGHFKNFIASVKGTEKPIAPPPIGQQAAIGGHMATMAYKNKKMVVWDAASKSAKFLG
jgi:predicted dehydrogenase